MYNVRQEQEGNRACVKGHRFSLFTTSENAFAQSFTASRRQINAERNIFVSAGFIVRMPRHIENTPEKITKRTDGTTLKDNYCNKIKVTFQVSMITSPGFVGLK